MPPFNSLRTIEGLKPHLGVSKDAGWKEECLSPEAAACSRPTAGPASCATGEEPGGLAREVVWAAVAEVMRLGKLDEGGVSVDIHSGCAAVLWGGV